MASTPIPLPRLVARPDNRRPPAAFHHHWQVGHTLMAGSVYDALRAIYPNCYPLHELAGALPAAVAAAAAVLPCQHYRPMDGLPVDLALLLESLRLPCAMCWPDSLARCALAGNWGKEAAGGGVELPSTVPAGLEYFNPGEGRGQQGPAVGSQRAVEAWRWVRPAAMRVGQTQWYAVIAVVPFFQQQPLPTTQLSFQPSLQSQPARI